jgi:hypothetical protein
MSAVKWNNDISEEFTMYQGVKQEGLLSAHIYKVYIEELLDLFENTEKGCKLGNINVNSVACADDIAFINDNRYNLQLLLYYSAQHSPMHH